MQESLDNIKPGEKAVVKEIDCQGAIRRRLIDMGVTPGALIVMRKMAPLGDPIEIHIRGYELSLRKSEAEKVMVEKV